MIYNIIASEFRWSKECRKERRGDARTDWEIAFVAKQTEVKDDRKAGSKISVKC